MMPLKVKIDNIRLLYGYGFCLDQIRQSLLSLLPLRTGSIVGVEFQRIDGDAYCAFFCYLGSSCGFDNPKTPHSPYFYHNFHFINCCLV